MNVMLAPWSRLNLKGEKKKGGGEKKVFTILTVLTPKPWSAKCELHDNHTQEAQMTYQTENSKSNANLSLNKSWLNTIKSICKPSLKHA